MLSFKVTNLRAPKLAPSSSCFGQFSVSLGKHSLSCRRFDLISFVEVSDF